MAKAPSVNVDSSPQGWADVRSAWFQYELRHQGINQLENLVGFIGDTLYELGSSPDKLEPNAYARWFDTMSALVPWKKLCTYDHNYVCSFVVQLGTIAQRSSDVQANSGRKVPAQWLAQLKDYFDGANKMGLDLPAKQTFIVVMGSSLEKESKLQVCKRFATPERWLYSQTQKDVLALLPKAADKAFKMFPWNTHSGETNKQLVVTFLPKYGPLLELSLADDDWLNKDTVSKTLGTLVAAEKTKKCDNTLELPFDFSDEP